MTLTTDELRQIAETDHVQCGDAAAMARELLANRDAQPVAWEMRYWNSGHNMWGDWERITAEQHAEMSVQHAADNDYEFRMLYDAPPAPAVPDGWIPCSEQTPVADGAYWCWFGKEKPSVIQQRVCIWNDRNHEWCDSSVTHWMPLPAAPEGGNDHDTRR